MTIMTVGVARQPFRTFDHPTPNHSEAGDDFGVCSFFLGCATRGVRESTGVCRTESGVCSFILGCATVGVEHYHAISSRFVVLFMGCASEIVEHFDAISTEFADKLAHHL
jgi:hypothetical protein